LVSTGHASLGSGAQRDRQKFITPGKRKPRMEIASALVAPHDERKKTLTPTGRRAMKTIIFAMAVATAVTLGPDNRVSRETDRTLKGAASARHAVQSAIKRNGGLRRCVGIVHWRALRVGHAARRPGIAARTRRQGASP
jgi:hypothetical protein